MYLATAPPSNAEAHQWNSRRGLPSFGFEIRTPQERYEHHREQPERADEVVRYHEAGHALTAAVLGFKRVVVDMGPDPEGGVQPRDEDGKCTTTVAGLGRPTVEDDAVPRGDRAPDG